MIKTRSVYSPIDKKKDGLRILATRIRGRGLRKSRYDVWMACLGPSDELREQFNKNSISWAEFRKRYRKELFEGGTTDKRNRTIKNHGQKFTLRLLQTLAKRDSVTIMCHCDEDQKECHRHILQKILRGKV
jgi:uncharacterized protein YeaO (DUF488 family)